MEMILNGRSVPGKGRQETVWDPSTGRILETYHGVDEQQCLEALESAQRAFPIWSGFSIEEREKRILGFADALEEQKESFISLLMKETGKPLTSAQEDFQMLPDCLRFFHEENKRLYGKIIPNKSASHLNLIEYMPVGVVVGYLAWNFPLLNVGYKLGPILASGCTCVLKPSAVTPLTTMKVGELAQSFFPAGVVNIVAGDSGLIGRVLNKSKIPAMITLIGSSEVGRKVMEESTSSIKHYSLELGGNAPAIVMKDADISKAAKNICIGKFSNAGQICVAPNRIFVHTDVKEAFLKEVDTFVSQICLECGDDREKFMMGPLSTEKACGSMEALIEDAKEKGAVIRTGGKRTGKGYFFEPTVITNVTRDMRIYQEEIFGPIMSVIFFDDSDNIAELANDTEYGLAAYLYTNNLQEAISLTEQIRAGDISVNEPLYDYNLPHGGLKESGIGKDCSLYSLQEYYDIKRVSIVRK